ncbi:DUF7544 domain-containing protein [Halobellus sp. GM3]|uniref:DUF7544 domain-containing protein n=1 Tax=Halobellus sp. GM3 TaxID=3458410 RepID=UPI00403E1846
MSLYAVDAIDDAIDATRAFLWPFDLRRWAKLALVMLFVGAGGGFSPFQFSGGAPSGTGSDVPTPPGGPGAPSPEMVLPGGAELAVIGLIFGVIAVIVFGFMFVGSVMEFVFVESLRRESVALRRYWSERWRQGGRLFVFRVILGLLTLALVSGIALAVLAPIVFGDGGFSVGLLFLAVPVVILVVAVSGLVDGFTTMFVVPVMIAEDRTLLSAWRRFWSVMTGQWKQYAVYAVLGLVLQIAAGILASIATALAAIVVAIPLGVVGVVGIGLLSVAEIAGWAVIAVAILLFVIAMFVAGLFISVPVQTYLRYYALFVLGDTEAAFDVISDRRQAVRE